MKTHSLYFVAPGRVEIREQELPVLQAGQVLVRTRLSAISPGTEMLIYHGIFPKTLPVDACLPGLTGRFAYPLRYGYAAVGEVSEIGPDVPPEWSGRRVLAYMPHERHGIVPLQALVPLPDDLDDETAAFLPNMETAVNCVQDGAPLLGERVLVIGQGVVGLLTSALLGEFPLAALVAADRYALRRQAATELGLTKCLDPQADDYHALALQALGGPADLTFELSGHPAALNDAIALTGFDGRVVIGSWYGERRADLDLGGAFHRSRLKMISSQVSTLAPAMTGRWDKARRLSVALEALRRLQPARWITGRIPFEQAARAYDLLDRSPEAHIQIVLTYHD